MLEKNIMTIPILEAFERSEACPLCHLWNKTEQACLERVEANEVTMDPQFRKKVIASAGFCNRHMHRLFEVSFSGHTENGLGYALYMRDVIDHLERRIDLLRADSYVEKGRARGQFPVKRARSRKPSNDVALNVERLLHGDAKCPICEMLLDSDMRTIGTFLKMLRDEAFADSYAQSRGICLSHFASSLRVLAKEEDRSESVIVLLFRVQLENLSNLRTLLDSRIRKYAWDHRDEALSGDEAGSQRTSLRMIAGVEGLYCRERKGSIPS